MPARQTYQSYTVVKGDTVAALAKRFNTTVAAIAATSGLADPNKISVGQHLYIPVTTPYDPDELDLAEVQVTAKTVPMSHSAPKTDPRPGTPTDQAVIDWVNTLADWLKPPKLWCP